MDDLGGDLHLADVVQERRELGLPPLARVEPEPVGDRDDEIDDVSAVAARVLVVGLDHVAEEHRRAAVRGRQLECVVDPALPLAREGREEEQHRQHEQERPRMPVRREGDEQAERREQRVDGEGGQHGAELRERRDLDRGAQEDECEDDVEDELRAERRDVDRKRAPARLLRAGRGRGRAPGRSRTRTSRRRARAGRPASAGGRGPGAARGAASRRRRPEASAAGRRNHIATNVGCVGIAKTPPNSNCTRDASV